MFSFVVDTQYVSKRNEFTFHQFIVDENDEFCSKPYSCKDTVMYHNNNVYIG